jgi:hypothetical protein
MASNPFVGTWRLVSLESRTAEGEVSYPLGRDAVGYIVYSEDGYVSVNLMAAGRPRYASGDQLRGAADEKAAAADTYVAYCGKYEVQQGKVIHHVEVSFFPNWVGVDQERFFEFGGNRLVLSTPPILLGGTKVTTRLVWERTTS